MTTFLLIVFVVLLSTIGAAVGSFLNVVIWRVPEKMSLISPPSHCPICNAPVRWFDNIPIFSWFILRGKCRDCKTAINFRYPLVETLSFLVALIVAWALLLGNWTGMKSQPFYWDNYSAWTNSYDKSILATEKEPLNEVAYKMDANMISSNVFLSLLRSTSLLAIVWTVIVDLTLMLGFVEWDRNYSPRSLIYVALAVLLFALLFCFLINEVDKSLSVCCTFLCSAFLGALGVCLLLPFLPNMIRFEQITLGVIWGVCAGYYLALPGALIISAIANLIFTRFKKQFSGLLYFGGLMLLIVMEISFSSLIK